MSPPRVHLLLLVGVFAALLLSACGEDRACADQARGDCDADSCRAFTAARLDTAADCLRMEVAACGEPFEGPCNQAIVNARGPDGVCWKFFDGCLPEGFDMSSECQSELSGKARCAQ